MSINGRGSVADGLGRVGQLMQVLDVKRKFPFLASTKMIEGCNLYSSTGSSSTAVQKLKMWPKVIFSRRPPVEAMLLIISVEISCINHRKLICTLNKTTYTTGNKVLLLLHAATVVPWKYVSVSSTTPPPGFGCPFFFENQPSFWHEPFMPLSSMIGVLN